MSNLVRPTSTLVVLGGITSLGVCAFCLAASNPIIWADVPDMSMVRVGLEYYMSSTTMHMSPGVPIMRSTDLANWTIVDYAYKILDNCDELNLANGKNAYGGGSWASSLRFHNGRLYVSTFSHTTGKTYIYWTEKIGSGIWHCSSFRPALHDHSLFFDEDGRVYMVYGAGEIKLAELKEDLSGIKEGGLSLTIITNAHSIVPGPEGLPAEGSQLFKHDGWYYLFNICWPRGGMRTVLIHRARKLTGPWEGRIGLQDRGIAQGGVIDTPDGRWYAYLFRDYGAVGRVPYLVPVRWIDGWPVLGVDGKVPDVLPELPDNRGPVPGIVGSDEFDRKAGDRPIPLVWQWNHNPVSGFWSVTERMGYLRLRTIRVDAQFEQVRNMLTQRTFGPYCVGEAAVEVDGMKDGDLAGLALLQKFYGFVGVKREGKSFFVVVGKRGAGGAIEEERVPIHCPRVYLKAECDFRGMRDLASFSYSVDGLHWIRLGDALRMRYTLPHFMGYRFALFNWATVEAGGFVDFDYFRVGQLKEVSD